MKAPEFGLCVTILLWTLVAITLGMAALNHFYPPLHTSLPKWLDEQKPSLEIVAR